MKHGLALIGFAALVACSGTKTTTVVVEQQPDAGATAAPTSSASTDDAGTPTNNEAGAPDGGGTPIAGGSCTVPNLSTAGHVSLFARNGAVYIGLDTDTTSTTYRRYTAVSTTPCVLTQDMAFGTNGALDVGETSFVDTQNRIWAAQFGGPVERVFPASAALDCNQPSGLNGEAAFSLAQDGSAGFVHYASNFGATDPREWARIVTTASTCTVTQIDGPTAALDDEMAVDAKGRLHTVLAVGSDTNNMRTENITIIDTNGATVSSYGQVTFSLDTFYGSYWGLGQCGDGICFATQQDSDVVVTAVDSDGNVTSKGTLANAVADQTTVDDIEIAGDGNQVWVATNVGGTVALSLLSPH